MKLICPVNVLSILTNAKQFPKTISQKEFDYRLFTKLPRVIVARDISPSSFKLKEVFYFLWKNKYSNLKTICYIKQTPRELTPCEISHIYHWDF